MLLEFSLICPTYTDFHCVCSVLDLFNLDHRICLTQLAALLAVRLAYRIRLMKTLEKLCLPAVEENGKGTYAKGVSHDLLLW